MNDNKQSINQINSFYYLKLVIIGGNILKRHLKFIFKDRIL
jgi:hypothetical protein